MGMYTELNVGVEFNRDTPKEVIEVIDFMATEGVEDCDLEHSFDHPLFKTDRWKWMLNSGGSYYFNAQPTLVWRHDEINRSYYLTFCTNIKNYGDEWEKFLDFIAPYVDEGYIGTYRYEEDELPSLVLIKDKKAIIQPCEPAQDTDEVGT